MPVELGYCMGHNQKLNALEYHRSSEVNVSVTDYIVFLGRNRIWMRISVMTLQ